MKQLSGHEYIKHIYKLKFITRYSNQYRICDEDVAQHSFFVTAILLQLHDVYDFDLGLALQAAVSHDILEADLSDITHDIKVHHPDLKKEIIIAEKKEILKYPKAVQDGYNLFENLSCPVGVVANLADILQTMQYLVAEEVLGNTTLKHLLVDSRNRIASLRKELKPYERNPKRTK